MRCVVCGVQDRLECGECHGVRYSSVSSSELSLPIPLPEPLPPTEPADGAKPGKPEDKQYPPTPLQACLQAWKAKTSNRSITSECCADLHHSVLR